MLALWASAGIPAQVWDLPVVFPATGIEWGDSGRSEGELVSRYGEARVGKQRRYGQK